MIQKLPGNVLSLNETISGVVRSRLICRQQNSLFFCCCLESGKIQGKKERDCFDQCDYTLDYMEISRDIGYPSPTSSPPTPPSPLPISVGPGNQKYIFSPSPSPSPPFSPPGSSCTSTDNLPLLLEEKYSGTPRKVPFAFSLDRKEPDDEHDSEGSSCLQDLLEWFFGRCCHCCSTLL